MVVAQPFRVLNAQTSVCFAIKLFLGCLNDLQEENQLVQETVRSQNSLHIEHAPSPTHENPAGAGNYVSRTTEHSNTTGAIMPPLGRPEALQRVDAVGGMPTEQVFFCAHEFLCVYLGAVGS